MEVRQLPTTKFQENHQLLRFIITNTLPAFANALRRIIIAYVPTIAIEEVIMVENTLPMFDEYIAHRLGLTPLNSDIDDLEFQETCSVCGGTGCSNCTVSLTLTMETDKNTNLTIYSRDLVSNDPRVYPVSDDIPIMRMGSNQRLILEAIARFGTGKEHAKFQPTSSIGYQYMPIIEIHSGHKFTREVADVCPRNVLEFDEDTQNINIKNLLNCNLCMECTTVPSGNGISIRGDESQIIFLVESNGSLPVENIVTKAADILRDMAEDFIESLNKALDDAHNDPKIMKKVSTFERLGLNQEPRERED